MTELLKGISPVPCMQQECGAFIQGQTASEVRQDRCSMPLRKSPLFGKFEAKLLKTPFCRHVGHYQLQLWLRQLEALDQTRRLGSHLPRENDSRAVSPRACLHSDSPHTNASCEWVCRSHLRLTIPRQTIDTILLSQMGTGVSVHSAASVLLSQTRNRISSRAERGRTRLPSQGKVTSASFRDHPSDNYPFKDYRSVMTALAVASLPATSALE